MSPTSATLLKTTLSVFDNLTALLYPRYCPACLVEMPNGEGWICEDCWLNQPFGKRITFPAHSSLDNKVTTAFAYTVEFRRLIHMMKFHARTDIARILGVRAAKRFIDLRQSLIFDAVVPVPLHPVRIRERGYDQNYTLAEAISKFLNVALADRLILRVRNTPAQARLSNEERIRNLDAAFAPASNINKVPNSVLLIDDVIHTGTTAANCIDVMKAAGVKHFHVLACCG
ncbi:ComF family protein [Calditrichota bacterium]